MSSHNHHKWQAYAHFGAIRVRCEDCGVDIPWEELQEAQVEALADAHAKITRQEEEIRILAAQRQDYKAHAAKVQQEYDRAIFDMQAMIDHAQQQAQQLAEARALLEETGNANPGEAYGPNDDMSCRYCGGWPDYSSMPPATRRADYFYQHEADCYWLKVRAFLQKLSG